jgi:hypothetical protein
MLTEKDKAFLQYWEQNRDSLGTFVSKLSRGLPMAVLFTLPILLFIIVVWVFFPDWYMKISKTSPGMFVTAIFAMVLVTLFYSFFRMQFKWESNEQLYNELKARQRQFENRQQENPTINIEK